MRFKKAGSLLLVGALTLSGFMTPAFTTDVKAAEAPEKFNDVRTNDWFYNYVMWACVNHIMTGYGNGSGNFGPGNNLARAEFAQTLYNHANRPAANAVKFGDMSGKDWYVPAVSWATNNKVMTGYTNGNFGGGNPVLRQEVATVLFRYANAKGFDTSKRADLSKFGDVSQITPYAKEAWSEPIVESRSICNQCGASFATNTEVGYHIKESMMNGGNCGSAHNEEIITGYTDHPAEYGTRQVLVKNAWQEQVQVQAGYWK